jgi:chromosome partitioning protein
MQIIALINQKGGVGKTTSTLNIGVGLAQLGKKVLLIDLDPQAHLTYSLGIECNDLQATTYELLKGEFTLKEILIEKEGIALAPASLDLSGAEIELSSIPGREFLLKEALKNETSYDYIFLDCPPSLGILTLNGLTTANQIYIPLQTEYLSLKGLSKLIETVEIVRRRLNPQLEITGIIGTRFDKRKKLNKEIIDTITTYFGEKLFCTLIRDNIAVAEAPSFGKSIFSYKPDSNGAEDYLSLSREILARSHE